MKKIYASIITIGDELLIGQTIDTNSSFIAKEFNRIGILVRRRVAVGDVWDDIWTALNEEKQHSSIIIITGGLGPTADDITKPLLANYFGGKLLLNKEILTHIEHLFNHVFRRPGPMLERNIKQAEVPDNCTVLFNKNGTAPGMWFKTENEIGKRIFVSMPGVPFEMKGLLLDEVIPRLQKEFKMPYVAHRTVFTIGLGESYIAEKLIDFEKKLPNNITLAYLPNYGMVRLRLSAFGKNEEETEKLLNPLHKELQLLMKEYVVADEDKLLQEIIGELLLQKNKTMGTAESCTGGYMAHLITSIAGSSAYYKGSVISYANEVKEKVLGVKEETINSMGAVSENTVTEMVQGAIRELNVDYAVATSGIMGPDGGTPDKPVGTVWIAAGNKDKIETKLLQLRFDRKRNTEMAANAALNFLRQFILAN